MEHFLRWRDFDDAIVEYLASEFKKGNEYRFKIDLFCIQKTQRSSGKKQKLNFLL